jgi:hypothetical protein
MPAQRHLRQQQQGEQQQQQQGEQQQQKQQQQKREKTVSTVGNVTKAPAELQATSGLHNCAQTSAGRG